MNHLSVRDCIAPKDLPIVMKGLMVETLDDCGKFVFGVVHEEYIHTNTGIFKNEVYRSFKIRIGLSAQPLFMMAGDYAIYKVHQTK